MSLFREDLSETEVTEMKDWARNHPEFNESYQDNIGIWHPIVIAEYNQIALSKSMLRSISTTI